MLSSALRSFDDPAEFESSVRGADAKIFVTGQGQYRSEHARIDLHCLWMQRFRQSLPTAAYIALHKNRAPIALLAAENQPPFVHSGIQVGPGDIVASSIGDEHHVSIPADCIFSAASLTPEDLAKWGKALVGYELTPPRVTRVFRPAAHCASHLQSLHNSAANLAASAPDVLSHPEIAKAIEQGLVSAIVACLADPEALDRTRLRSGSSAVMRRFERLLEDWENRPIYVAEACAELGVNDRTLRMYCQDHLGMSPQRYLWLRRMNLAQRALVRADATMRTVTQIANDHGFGELGRFAVAYRSLFGESPSATLRRTPDVRPSLKTRPFWQAISDCA